ncbi:TldD/PmbA family protein [Bacteriovorax sp. PP10]|uniref:TldD/PmbA family protein n=1 Tax=Bacteriovorax antarcticus TaxID=3088717 RepID=A0ABU5VRJ9_9BACT|nr:TldD/PmbA family protein [Bacteriovorax sp. PP10]MEA9355672.1 TldD/PmbA family protein [Bacteriovorax sp. PP10]
MNLKEILNSLTDLKAEYISLREVKSRSLSMNVRNEVFEGLSTSEDHGLMIEVMMNGQFAYGATNSFEPSEVKKCAEKAKAAAIEASRFSLSKFSLDERPMTVGEYKSPGEIGIDGFNPKEATELLMNLSTAMKVHDHVISRVAQMALTEMDTHFVASNGSDIKQSIHRSGISISAVASSELGNQRRSYGDDQSTQFGLEKFNSAKLIAQATRIANEAMELLNAEECPTETMDLLLAPDQLYLQIHESIGHPLELDRILGDERNYAGWSFVKPQDFGNLKYGSPLMNVTFDPTVVGQFASYFADDIGNKATKEFLIKDGVLLRGLGSLESQKRLNLPGVASQRATSWNRAPIDRMANVNLEPGSSTLEDMIKSVKRGIFMQTNRSWSIDDYRNKFQFGCEYGRLIEDGKLTKLVKNPNYRGVTAPFWNQLKMVGDKSTFEVGGLGNCGKGEPNQVIFVGHASPVCLFSNIEVFGGGK